MRKKRTNTDEGLDVWQRFCEAQGTRCTVIRKDGTRCDGGVTKGDRCEDHQPVKSQKKR